MTTRWNEELKKVVGLRPMACYECSNYIWSSIRSRLWFGHSAHKQSITKVSWYIGHAYL